MVDDVRRNVVDLPMQDDPSVLPFCVLLHFFSCINLQLARGHSKDDENLLMLLLLPQDTIKDVSHIANQLT